MGLSMYLAQFECNVQLPTEGSSNCTIMVPKTYITAIDEMQTMVDTTTLMSGIPPQSGKITRT